jgi:hypothetical protein
MLNPLGRFEWHRRRRLIYATLAFCALSAVAIEWAAFHGADSTLLTTLATLNYGLAGATIGSYVFGAVWDDKNAMDAGYAPPTIDTSKIDPGTPG